MRGYSGDITEPMWCNGSTLGWNVRDAGSIPALGTMFPIFITPMRLFAMIMIFVMLWPVWLLNLPSVCHCKHYKTYNSRGTSIECALTSKARSCISK